MRSSLFLLQGSSATPPSCHGKNKNGSSWTPDRGILSLAERDDAILADVVVRGQRRDNGSAILVVIEVAPEIGAADAEQALHRTTRWTKLGLPAQPSVAGLTLSVEGERIAYDRHVLVSLLPDLLGPDALGRSAPARSAQTKQE